MSTLINMLRAGNLPGRIAGIAATESMVADDLCERITAGTMVAPAGNSGRRVRGVAIGSGVRTKVNANIGASSELNSEPEELAKLDAAVRAGADTVMDLSSGGDTGSLRRALISACDLPFGTVPIYEAASLARQRSGSVVAMTRDDLLGAVEQHAADGVDFMTIHAGLTLSALDHLQSQGRLMDVVSRGGAFMIAWMIHHERENPFYEDFDLLLDIMARWDVTISLGDGLRPGCLADASDRAQFEELVTLGRLAAAANEAGVQAMIEGPGHMPLSDIEANVKMAKKLTGGAPFYVLGPLVTDIAPGYDHITAAIGGAIAGAAGADYLCYVTPAEHLGLPTAAEVHSGVIASRIAAHAADIAKGSHTAMDWDIRMAGARKSLDWEEQIALAIDPQAARSIYGSRHSESVAGCSMCGELCAMKIVSDHLGLKAGEISGC
ncbi:MAG: phosphomethylpyrimidine synthase ThiC [Actinobacteria bacterium]|nr:phosphomethylpyrimidine synthase ThiC [Actinomycetota bacterium]